MLHQISFLLLRFSFMKLPEEKALRKKYLCVRTVARDAVVDAVGEIVLLSKMRKPPKNYSSAGFVQSVII